MFNSNKGTNTYTQRQDPQRGQRSGVVTFRKDGAEQPFPNKPVTHKRLPKTQVQLVDFEKITLSTQRGHLFHKEYQSNDIRKTNGSLQSRDDPHNLPKEELQLAKAINEKELMLQAKLWKVGEKIRQTVSAGTAGHNENKSEDEWQYGGHVERGNAQAKAGISEHQVIETTRKRDALIKESWHDDCKQRTSNLNHGNGDGIWSRPEVQQHAKWKHEESPHLKGQGVICRKKTNELSNKTRLQNVNLHLRRKDEEYGIWEDDERKYSKQKKASLGDAGLTRGRKYKEKTHPSTLYDQPELPERSLGAENQTVAGGKLSGEPTLPLVPTSFCGQHQQVEPAVTDDCFQLFPCKVCNRKFKSDRLEKHIQICKKVKQSQRQVFNSYVHRTKGSQAEEFFKTHTRSRTPEAIRKNKRQNCNRSTSNQYKR
ncbi:uncharacterized protein ACNS7B_000607 [Menidia menidia]